MSVNTYTVPDRFTVYHEGQVLLKTTCVGTNEIVNDCYTDAGVGVRGTTVCCDGAGDCTIEFFYEPRTDTHITVEVEPNCEGTGETEWKFRVECPD